MITITRTYQEKATPGYGRAKVGLNEVVFKTLELPWKNNERRVSCIPEGTYRARSHNSPKFGQSFHILDVPGRSEILIHPGNFTREILGCILPGTAHRDIDGDGIIDVISSKVAMKYLIQLLWNVHEFDVVITSQSGPPSS